MNRTLVTVAGGVLLAAVGTTGVAVADSPQQARTVTAAATAVL